MIGIRAKKKRKRHENTAYFIRVSSWRESRHVAKGDVVLRGAGDMQPHGRLFALGCVGFAAQFGGFRPAGGPGSGEVERSL